MYCSSTSETPETLREGSLAGPWSRSDSDDGVRRVAAKHRESVLLRRDSRSITPRSARQGG